MAFCSNCGIQLKNDAKFCHQCGEAVLGENETTSPQTVKPSYKKHNNGRKSSTDTIVYIFTLVRIGVIVVLLLLMGYLLIAVIKILL